MKPGIPATEKPPPGLPRRAVNGNGIGYDAEFRISLALLGNPKAGDIIGFNIAVNDDDDGGDAERQVSWSGLPHKPVTYGNLLLGRTRLYSAPK